MAGKPNRSKSAVATLPNTRLAWADRLSDQVWADICAAAGRTPDAAARSALREILYLYGYPWVAYDRKRVADRLKRMKRSEIGSARIALPREAVTSLTLIMFDPRSPRA